MEPQAQEEKSVRSLPWTRLVQALVYFLVLPFVPLLVAWDWGWWQGGVTAGLMAAGIIVRTALEDRTLQAELPGYAEYARQTRYRLLPGIW